MQVPSEVADLARAYLRTYFVGLPLIYGYFCVDATFRASGDTRTPLVILSLSVACTLLLDPVLILGLAGAPKLGIAGAAVALLATRGAAFAIGLLLLRRRGMLQLHLGAQWDVIRRVLRIGLPTAMTGVIFSLIYVGLTRTTTQFGTPVLAALGLGHRIESWLYMIGVGFGASAAAIVGQNMGAGQIQRAERAGWITVGFAMIPAAAMAIVSLLLPAEIVLEGSLGGAGHTVPPMLTSTALTALRIPLASWWATIWGPVGIWWAISITAAGRGIAMMLLWRQGRWKHKSV